MPIDVALDNPRATFEQAGLPIAAAIDNDGTSAWAVDPQFGRDHAAAFEAAEPFGFPGGTEITVTLRFANNLKHSIGRPRLAVTSAGGAGRARCPVDPPGGRRGARNASRGSDGRPRDRVAGLVQDDRPRLPATGPGRARTCPEGPEAAGGQGADLVGGPAGGPAAYAGARLLRDDLSPPSRRPEPEGPTGRTGLPPRPDGLDRGCRALEARAARRVADVVPSRLAGELDHRHRATAPDGCWPG